MPHLKIEYSAGLEDHVDMMDLCLAAHEAMKQAGIFPLAGIRVRTHRANHAITGDLGAPNAFAAMTMSVGTGRSVDVLRAAGDAVYAAVKDVVAGPLGGEHFALSLEIREINADLSWKDNPIHTRLSREGTS